MLALCKERLRAIVHSYHSSFEKSSVSKSVPQPTDKTGKVAIVGILIGDKSLIWNGQFRAMLFLWRI
jgi:hypothetical protein